MHNFNNQNTRADNAKRRTWFGCLVRIRPGNGLVLFYGNSCRDLCEACDACNVMLSWWLF